jgi:hypothetical protein
MTFQQVLDAIKGGADIGTILLKLAVGIVEAIMHSSGKSTDEVLSDIRVEIAATNKAREDAEAAERKVISGG